MYSFKRLFNPELFQGVHKRTNYFEGWYYKLIDRQARNAFAVIPGVSFGSNEKERHAFVQILHAEGCGTHYAAFNLSDFRANKKRFEIEIGKNYFTRTQIRLELATDEFDLKGQLFFDGIIPYPKTLFSPGIMGPFSYVPFMECHHGIVSVHHDISGTLNWCGSRIDFNGGGGYIEKDWGTSFPESWIWIQSNHFSGVNATFLFSMAKIPWLGRAFTGLLCFLRLGSKFYIFATYTGARVTVLDHSGDNLSIRVEDRRYQMDIAARRTEGGTLKAPRNGLMTGEITESICAEIDIRLSGKDGRPVFTGKGRNAGLEIKNEKAFCPIR
jgi:hypothetical protein